MYHAYGPSLSICVRLCGTQQLPLLLFFHGKIFYLNSFNGRNFEVIFLCGDITDAQPYLTLTMISYDTQNVDLVKLIMIDIKNKTNPK